MPDLRLPSQQQGIGHDRRLTSIKGAYVCEQLAQSCYLKARGWGSDPRPTESQVQRPNHYATVPHPRSIVLACSNRNYILIHRKYVMESSIYGRVFAILCLCQFT